jgi:EpsI family protein
MSPLRRVLIGVVFLSLGLVAQAGLEELSQTDRPTPRARLSSIPLVLGDWEGRDVELHPDVLREAQTDDYVNRVYEDRRSPGRQLSLWMNYSRHGLNLRHSPEICLPSGGWTKVEPECRVIEVRGPDGAETPITRLVYTQGELVQGVGFWYYIFGEGPLERYARRLPITSRSSHGRTTRGSGLTVEVFCPGATDPDGTALQGFAEALLGALDPILPRDRAEYYIP